MNKKKKILIVHNYYQIPGGEDVVVANESKMLEENGHEVVRYFRNNTELSHMPLIKKILLPIITIFNIRTYRDIKRIIKEERIDIVHVHNTLLLVSPAVYYAAIACGVPVVQTVHNFRLLCPGATFYRDYHICEECVEHGLRCAIKHKCYRDSRLQTLLCVFNTWFHRKIGIYKKISYICLTEFNKDKILKLGIIRKDKVFIKSNYVDELSTPIPYNSRKKQLVFVGRLDKLKGIDILFSAWEKMGTNAPKLVVCGTGPMEKWCNEFLKNNKCNIEMMGFLSHERVRTIMKESEALVFPTQWYEGFALVIVEAFSVGTPVICSDIGNPGNLVREGITGRKFKHGDVDALVSAIEVFTREEKDSFAVNAYTECLEKYTKSKNYQILCDIYNSEKIYG